MKRKPAWLKHWRPAPAGLVGTVRSVVPRKQQRSGINSAVLQEHLESASNAAVKGQAQWHTPSAWAAALALALPVYRPVIVDLTCGSGALLSSVAGKSTRHLLGCEIEPTPAARGESGHRLDADTASGARTNFVQADVTKFYPLLRDVNWQADLFALNPPWDLHWYRERLQALAESDCAAVRAAFVAHDGRTQRDTIDSTIATLCLALDRCSHYGEGFLIANEATLQRLIFGGNAPHAALRSHIWAHLVVAGNICETHRRGTETQNFQTGVIYFARTHNRGIINNSASQRLSGENSIGDAQRICAGLFKQRLLLRKGAEIATFAGGHTADSAELWNAAREEWSLRTATDAAKPAAQFNIYLDADGALKTNLSLFETASGRVNKSEAARLFALNGRHPMQLVVQRAERRELERAVFGPNGDGRSPWRVAPAVMEAVASAIAQYNAVRAPLVPLSKIQRLGYLDESDQILCLKNLVANGAVFRAGERYAIRTETLRVKRSGEKMNLTGELDEVQWEGSELALYVAAGGREFLCMEARLRDKNVRLSSQADDDPNPPPIDFTLQEFAGHFEIPEVPDVATRNPAGFNHYLNLLDQIERLAA